MGEGGLGLMGAPGFDDAPTTSIARGCAKRVTVVYPYYENEKFFERQLEHLSSMRADLRAYMSVIVVDDASPKNPAISVAAKKAWPIDLKLYRIEKDVRWNWLAARNIGMHHASDGWAVMTDMDHVIPEDTIDGLVFGVYDTKVIYRFLRKEHTGQDIHPHPNSMFMTRAMFWKVGGYDEALSGYYGTDGDWRRRCAAKAEVLTLPLYLVRHEHQDDSSTIAYLRKQPEDARKKAIVAKRKTISNWKPKTLSFPYHRVHL
jgi:glycosyltransferase involved in cell wall biosynthesis